LRQQLSELARATVTPGAASSFKNSLQAVVTQIEEELETKVKSGFTETQEKIGTLFSSLDAANTAANTAQQVAMKNDKVWFECVAEEQTKRQDVEAKDADLTTSRSNQEEACQLQQDNRGFTFDGKDKYSLQFSCDHIKGDCEAQLANWQATVLDKMVQDAKAAMSEDAAKHDALKKDCEMKKAVQVKAQSALDGATGEWAQQRKTCSTRKFQRETAVCDYGIKAQAKCTAESAFGAFVTSTGQAKGGQYSEADRKVEWAALGTTKCMVKAVMAKSLDEAVAAGDLEACAPTVDYTKDVGALDAKAAGVAAIKKANICGARDVSFFNGFQWSVPEGTEPKSEDYTRGPFTPNIDPTSGNFAFCA